MIKFWPLLLLLSAWRSSASPSLPHPSILPSVRVKNHFHRSGELVEGEQHLRKVILKWTSFPGATRYEVNHVHPHEQNEYVHVTPIDIEHTCGGAPCHVKPACPIGRNGFSVRALVRGGEEDGAEEDGAEKEEWTPWSPVVHFDINRDNAGQAQAVAADEEGTAREL